MNKLKRLAASIALMCVLAVTTFASTLPCADPGQTTTPPCLSQSANGDSADPGEILTPPAVPAVDVTDIAETLLRASSLF